MGAGYFLIWILLGLAVFPLGAALAEVLLRFPALAEAGPVATGLVVLVAGLQQFSAWKVRQLACCRRAGGTATSAAAAWRYGLRLGVRCIRCCAGPTAVLLVLGVMDLWVMTAVAVAIGLERLTPNGERFARAAGAFAIAAGSFLAVRGVAQGL